MKWTPVGLVVVAAAVVVWHVCSQPSEAPARHARVNATVSLPPAPEQREPIAEPKREPATQLAQAISVPAPEPPAQPNERAIMSTLRELADSAPERSLQLAREGNQRFPDSPDAAERGWYVCKSLVNLEDFYDAREEARAMVSKYAGTSWATDIQRHLLANPLDLPGDPAP